MHTRTHTHWRRYDAHLMFSLCHGKLCEETARLALARHMVKVGVCVCVRVCVYLSLVSGGVCNNWNFLRQFSQ